MRHAPLALLPFWLVALDASGFPGVFPGVVPDVGANTLSFNGNDVIQLVRNAGGGKSPVLDQYGVIGDRGAATPNPAWDYGDRAINRVVGAPAATFSQSDWLRATTFSPAAR